MSPLPATRSTRRALLVPRRAVGFSSPLDYAPALWLRASDIAGLADAAAVTTWPDISGNSRDATQATAARQPTFRTNVLNGQPVVRFDGGDGLSTVSVDLTGTSGVTLFVVASVVAGTDRALVELSDNYNSVTTGFLLFRAAAGNFPNWAVRGNASSGVAHTAIGATAMAGGTGVFKTLVGRADKSYSMQDVAFALNNTWAYTYTPGGAATVGTVDNTNTFGNHQINIGARDADGTITLPTQGDIAEILLIPRQLTGGETQNVGNYLAGRYGSGIWSNQTALVVYEGDSLTEGDKLPSGAYPLTLQRRFTDVGVVPYIPAVSGQTLAQMQADYATQIKPLSQPSLGAKNICVLWGGTNDMVSVGGNQTAATTLSRFYTYADTLRADGFKTVGLTIIPRTDAAAPGDFETKRQAFNADVDANWASHFDAIVQLHLDAMFDAAADSANATNYNADLVHLSATGYGHVADMVETALAAIGVT